MENLTDISESRQRGTGHTPGPWSIKPRVAEWTDFVLLSDARGLADVPLAWIEHRHSQGEANASLIAAAPAHSLMLEMLALGIARFERSGSLLEFCFGGMRYACSDHDWSTVIDVIGWDHARAAIAKATKGAQ